MTSKVAPPQTSSDQKPALSSAGATAARSSVRTRVANSDWWPSRHVRSVTWRVRRVPSSAVVMSSLSTSGMG